MHFQTNGGIQSSLLIQNAYRFVDFFFVLSGFVIAQVYRRRLQQGAMLPFLMRRIGRLWPLHAATLAAVVVMALAGSLVGLTVNGFLFSALPANLTMTHAWGFLDRITWNGPSWSISAEFFAYAFFALLVSVVRSSRLDVACAGVMVASLLVLEMFTPSGMGSTHDFGIVRCLFGFMAGALASSLWDKTAFRPRGEILALVLTFAAVAFLPVAWSPLIAPVFVWTVLVFASDAGVVSRGLRHAFPQMLGRISYSIYMTHYLVALSMMTMLALATGATRELEGVRTFVSHWWIADSVTVIYLAVVIIVSWVSHQWIERPGREWFNSRSTVEGARTALSE